MNDKQKQNKRGFCDDAERGRDGQRGRKPQHRPFHVSRTPDVKSQARPDHAANPKMTSKFRHVDETQLPDDILIGRNAVTEALKAGRGINKILIANGDREGSVSEIMTLAKERGVIVQPVERGKIESVAGGLRHQGVLAYVAPVAYADLDDVLEKTAAAGKVPFLLLLDELEDPHNLGALLRTADATGVDAVLIPKRRSVPLNATVAKTSAGAIEYVPVVRIGNVAQTLKTLKEKGFWVAGADMDGTQLYCDADLTGPLVLIVGSEGHGMSRLTKEACDFIVSLPMVGKINSLNASVAGSILMYEAMRQRLQKEKKG